MLCTDLAMRTGNGVEIILSVSPAETAADGRIHAMDSLQALLANESPQLEPLVPLHPQLQLSFPTFGPLFGGMVSHGRLARLLELVASQPWRMPGALQLLARDHTTQHCYRPLQGLKQIVEARSRAAAGLRPWWRVSESGRSSSRKRDSGRVVC